MTTNLKDVLNLIKTTLTTDADIASFCSTTFKKAPTIFLGINPLNPPKFEQHAPCIAVWVGGRARTPNQAHRVHAVNVGTAIMDDVQVRSGAVVEFRGVATLDDFQNLVEEAVVKALNANGYAHTQEPTFEDENVCPFFRAVTTLLIRCPNRI